MTVLPNHKHVHFSPLSVRHSVGIVVDPVAVYYERLESGDATRHRTAKPVVVMVHGGSHSGSCYLLTADGRPGWAYAFADQGYPVVVVDWPGTGRSGALADADISAETLCAGLQGVIRQIGGTVILLTHSMGAPLGWRLAELCAEQVVAVVAIAPGPPGNIQPIPEVLSRTAAALDILTPSRVVRLPTTARIANDPATVRDKLIGTSRHFPREYADTYTASLLQTPTALVAQRINLDDTQIRVADPARLAGKPILVVTGTEDIDHPRETDGTVVDWLNTIGADAELLWLGDLGISGNGHMMMLERNSDEIALRLIQWLEHLPQVAAHVS